MAILVGLQNSAISRLKKSWAELGKKSSAKYKELMDLMILENNYRNYRQALEASVPPSIPFIAPLLSDLTMIDENSNTINGNLVNFKKRSLIAKVIKHLSQYSTTPYNLEFVPPLQEMLIKLRHTSLSEDALYTKSLEREPRNPEDKREQTNLDKIFKSLKLKI